MDKISIIIPIYNREQFLKECLESVLQQTHQNFELLLVDDGSTDTSLEIIKSFQEQDNRILVFTKKNGGVSSARNLALDHVTGKYIMFLDSDDRFHKDLLSHLLKNLMEAHADISICDVEIEINGKINNSTNKLIKKSVFTPEVGVKDLTDQSKYLGYVTNKLFKTELIKENQITFNESIHIYEDQLFTLKAFIKSNIIVYESIPLYYYVIHDTNISNLFDERRLSGVEGYKQIINLVNTYYPLYVNEYRNVLAKILISMIASCIPDNKKYLKPLQSELKTIQSSITGGKMLKISMQLAIRAPRLLKILIKFKNRGQR